MSKTQQHPKIEFSFDDGHLDDLRVARLLVEYGFRAMFYITVCPTSTQTMSTEEIKSLIEAGHEVGFHSYSHPHDMKLLSNEDVEMEVVHRKKELEEELGVKMTSFCYPRGKFDKRAESAVINAGYEEARTVDVLCVTQHFDPYRKPTTIHIHPLRSEYEGRPWLDVAKEKFDEALTRSDGYFHVWGHGWEIDKFKQWEEFEQLLIHMQNRLYAKEDTTR